MPEQLETANLSVSPSSSRLMMIWQEIQKFAKHIKHRYFSAKLDLDKHMFHQIYSICVDFVLGSQEIIVQETKK